MHTPLIGHSIEPLTHAFPYSMSGPALSAERLTFRITASDLPDVSCDGAATLNAIDTEAGTRARSPVTIGVYRWQTSLLLCLRHPPLRSALPSASASSPTHTVASSRALWLLLLPLCLALGLIARFFGRRKSHLRQPNPGVLRTLLSADRSNSAQEQKNGDR